MLDAARLKFPIIVFMFSTIFITVFITIFITIFITMSISPCPSYLAHHLTLPISPCPSHLPVSPCPSRLPISPSCLTMSISTCPPPRFHLNGSIPPFSRAVAGPVYMTSSQHGSYSDGVLIPQTDIFTGPALIFLLGQY